MKIAIIGINNSLLDLTNQNEVIDFIKFNIAKQGKTPSLVSYFSNNIEYLKYTMQQNFDIVFCIGSDSIIFNHNLKENLARIFGVKLEKNNLCEANIIDYCSKHNIVYSSQEEMQSLFPTNSQVLYCNNYFNNGFTYKFNNIQVIMLPSDIDFVKSIFMSNIMPYFVNNIDSSDNYITMTIRCYGLLEKDLRTIINEELNNSLLIFNIINVRLDNIIHIKYKNSDASTIQPVIADMCSKLSKLIYATEDTTLYQTAINLLNIQSKKIVLAETVTDGNITRNLMKLNSEIVEKAISTSLFDSIAKQLKLNERVVNQFGKYSVNTVYELDNLLLEQSSSELAVFVLGDKKIDTCFIAIGDIDGIHVYKNKVQSYDNSNIEMLSETTIFYLIKKLRQNDLQFR